ncbi:MAG: pyridoxal phosphate-dependent aminotransferase [Clostridium sp.]|nr:pyridoxal phosphate-dependent aminotransferase [Clostridium sp.]
MAYDFDTLTDRRGTNALKWDVAENELPLWVADMDFKTAPEIAEALQKRVEHGIFGYTVVPDEWYQAYISWWREQHGFTMKQDWLMFCTGVVPAISSVVRKLTTPAENVLIQTPVYNIFFNSILNNGRRVLESPLSYDGENYHIDFADLEQKLSEPQTTLMILCNPHNPVGKIWDGDTLAKIGELCAKHHVAVLSDEIHCDITDPGYEYTPFAAVSETCRNISITCIAPTKSFNLAGLQTAAICVPNEAIRSRVNRAINTDEVAEPNAFAVEGAVAAFTKGKPWLNELRIYLFENKQFVKKYIEKEIPKVKVVPSKATYLLWIDCSRLPGSSVTLARYIRENTGLYLTAGAEFGKNGDSFMRMNIACPRETLREGLERLKQGIIQYGECSLP